MPYSHVYAPTKGMITTIPPSYLPKEASPNILGMYILNGEIVSDYGMSAFPTAGTVKTNKVNGIPLKLEQFLLTTGVSHLLALTTTHAYEYNTTTTTWDNITKGQNVDDGETAWTASANVTATADTTIKLRGSKSAKMVIAAAFTTGLAAYFDFAAKDLTNETAMHFWVYSSIAVASGDLKLRISEQIAGGTGATYEDLTIPALSADTWTPVSVDFVTPADLNATRSVGLVVAVDNGAQTVYLDDIRSTDRFTGTADNLWSTGILNDTYIATNGVDQPQKYGGVVATGFLDLVTTLATGSITTSELVLIAKDHVVLLNNTENGADAPLRASWGNIAKIEDYVNGTAGYQDLTDDESHIIAAAQFSENAWVILKEKSLVVMEWVGGHTPFRFTTVVVGKTVAGKAAVISVDGIIFVFGTDVLYAYGGGRDTEDLDKSISNDLYGNVDFTYLNRSFLIWNETDKEIQIYVPTTTEYPDTVYCYNVEDKVWFKRKRTVTGYGIYFAASALTIGDLVGTIGDQNFTFGSTVSKANSPVTLFCDPDGFILKSDKATLNNDGDAIENTFESPDFFHPQTEETANIFRSFRVQQLIFEAKGQLIITEYSTDSGTTWNPTQTGTSNQVTLSSAYTMYQQDLDVVTTKIRFRFRNTTVSSGFYLRYYGFGWQARSTRK